MTDASKDADRAIAITKQIHALLAGLGPDVQGAILANLVATHLAGFQGPDAAKLREELLDLHIATVRDLIPASKPRCTIDGIEYDHIPVFNGEPAFLGDGGPNPDFDWSGWRQQKTAPASQGGEQ